MLRQFLIAMYFLFVYPRNRELTGTVFDVCPEYCGGERLFRWIRRISDLKEKKIVWKSYLDDPKAETFIISVDGTDLRRWEPSTHERYRIDTKQCSHKHKKAAGKFEIGLSIFRPQIVWMSGPYRGGKGDREIFLEGLFTKVKPGKLVVADGGYRPTSEADETRQAMIQMMALPSRYDSKELHNFKARARCRHETLNGRFHHFGVVSTTWRHGTAKLKMCMEAVVVIVQYQMENGNPIYDV